MSREARSVFSAHIIEETVCFFEVLCGLIFLCWALLSRWEDSLTDTKRSYSFVTGTLFFAKLYSSWSCIWWAHVWRLPWSHTSTTLLEILQNLKQKRLILRNLAGIKSSLSRKRLVCSWVMRVQVGFWHENLLWIIKFIEIQEFSYQLSQQQTIGWAAHASSIGVLPMQCTFSSGFWIFHLVLIVDDLEDRAADLRSELA